MIGSEGVVVGGPKGSFVTKGRVGEAAKFVVGEMEFDWMNSSWLDEKVSQDLLGGCDWLIAEEGDRIIVLQREKAIECERR